MNEMMRLNYLHGMALLCLACLASLAVGEGPITQSASQATGFQSAGDPLQVDTAEVIRRGNLEEYVADGETRFSDQYGDYLVQIAAAPANDNNKWFISVITQKNCPACAKLKEAWKTDATLRAYAIPENPRESWSHFTVYDYNDPYQSWRWKKSPSNPNPIEITAFPTIIVQPPRSKVYGDPQTVVLKYVYEGSPQKFSEAVNTAIRAYVDTLRKAGKLPEIKDVVAMSRKVSGGFASKTNRGFGSLDKAVDVSDQHGYGQVQVPPPLVLPLDEQPSDHHKRGRNLDNKQQILIVTDTQLVSSADQDKALQSVVQDMQTNPPVPVRKIDINDVPRNIAVKADEVPVVLLMEGNDIIAKRPVPRSNYSWGPIISLWLILGDVISFVAWVVGAFCTLFVLLFLAIVAVRTLQWAEILPKPLIRRGSPSQPTTPTTPTV